MMICFIYHMRPTSNMSPTHRFFGHALLRLKLHTYLKQIRLVAPAVMDMGPASVAEFAFARAS